MSVVTNALQVGALSLDAAEALTVAIGRPPTATLDALACAAGASARLSFSEAVVPIGLGDDALLDAEALAISASNLSADTSVADAADVVAGATLTQNVTATASEFTLSLPSKAAAEALSGRGFGGAEGSLLVA